MLYFRRQLFFLCFSGASVAGISQPFPKDYFQYPLDIPPRLNANFGELRPHHFHMGLDLFTDRRENLPVRAAADGYVGRVKIEPGGFGKAIYLYHPNGMTTLYAHMNSFFPELEKAIRERQYQQESWQMEWELPAGSFPVKKGQMIGKSGNTGASAGPHVHFEVRETSTDKCLNPLLFGFDIPDKVAPEVYRLAVYDRNKSVYHQAPLLYTLQRQGGSYVVPGLIRVNTDRFSIAVQSTDRMSGTPNPNGIYGTLLFEGNQALGGFRLDRIGYESTRYLNAHIDYLRRSSGGGWLQFLFPLPGDTLDIWTSDPRAEGIQLPDKDPHRFRLLVFDSYGNSSELQFTVQYSGLQMPNLMPEGLMMAPGEVGIYEDRDIQVVLDERALYDTIFFTHRSRPGLTSMSFSDVHALHRPEVPVHNYFQVSIRPSTPIPADLAEKMIIRRTGKGKTIVRKAVYQSGWYMAKFRDFGEFELLADNQPPTIHIHGLSGTAHRVGSTIVVDVADNHAAIHHFRAELDGRWLMFEQKGNRFTYRLDERFPPGRHTLDIHVEDEAGNKSSRSVVLHR